MVAGCFLELGEVEPSESTTIGNLVAAAGGAR